VKREREREREKRKEKRGRERHVGCTVDLLGVQQMKVM